MRAAERKYYDDLFQENKCNLVKSWKVIKEVIDKRKKSKTPNYFIVDNKEIVDKVDIATRFNEFYVNLGPSLAKKIPPTDIDTLSYIKNEVTKSIFLEPEVIKILKDIKKSSAGWDGISPKIIKMTYRNFLVPLLYICNLSILQGVFLLSLK